MGLALERVTILSPSGKFYLRISFSAQRPSGVRSGRKAAGFLFSRVEARNFRAEFKCPIERTLHPSLGGLARARVWAAKERGIDNGGTTPRGRSINSFLPTQREFASRHGFISPDKSPRRNNALIRCSQPRSFSVFATEEGANSASRLNGRKRASEGEKRRERKRI